MLQPDELQEKARGDFLRNLGEMRATMERLRALQAVVTGYWMYDSSDTRLELLNAALGVIIMKHDEELYEASQPKPNLVQDEEETECPSSRRLRTVAQPGEDKYPLPASPKDKEKES